MDSLINRPLICAIRDIPTKAVHLCQDFPSERLRESKTQELEPRTDNKFVHIDPGLMNPHQPEVLAQEIQKGQTIMDSLQQNSLTVEPMNQLNKTVHYGQDFPSEDVKEILKQALLKTSLVTKNLFQECVKLITCEPQKLVFGTHSETICKIAKVRLPELELILSRDFALKTSIEIVTINK